MSRTVCPEGSLLAKEPSLVEEEWVYSFNDLLHIRPEDVSTKSSEMVYWRCRDCGDIFKMSPRKRLEQRERNRTSCFRCRGRVQLHSVFKK